MTDSDFAVAKQAVRALMDALANATPSAMAGVLARHVSPDWEWRGVHPFHRRQGPDAVAEVFWAPLASALRCLQRRPDIFMAGRNQIDDFRSIWVIQAGHFMGLFDAPFLGIPPTGKIAMLRYAEFNRVEDGRIVETGMFVDLPQLMIQAGLAPFPPETGAHLVQPGPIDHDGLMWADADPAQAGETLALMDRLRASASDLDTPYRDRLAREWHEDMIWWGPYGIGASYTIDRYALQHALPFRLALSDGRRYNGLRCMAAEGRFGAYFNWSNTSVKNSGGFMGMTASADFADMSLVDIYRASGGKFAENWVFIDLLNYLFMQGLDVLGRMRSLDYVDRLKGDLRQEASFVPRTLLEKSRRAAATYKES